MARRSGAAARKNAESARGGPALRPMDGSGATALDPLIHQRTRLAILSLLAAHESVSFSDLKQSLDVSDGNLSVHARKLEDAGYISCRKSFAGRVPLTEYRLSRKGQGALERYLTHMEDLIAATRRGR